MTINLNEKDKELLYELDKNCRQSLNQLAKKLESKKTVIAYRIKRLESSKIIKGYYTLIDSFLLGYSSYRIYFIFQNLTPKIEKEIINYFVKDKGVYFISSLEGKFDLVVTKWIKEIKELYSFFVDFMQKYRQYIQSYLITPYEHTLFGSKYLTEKPKFEKRVEWRFSTGEIKQIDKLDLEILREISYNAKSSIVEIGAKLGVIPNTVKYRIKKLKEAKIIKAFRADIDFNLLGYKWFKVDVHLNNYIEYDKILDFIKISSNTFVIDKSIGLADIEAEFHYKNVEELRDFLNKLILQFPKLIKNYNYIIIREIYKIDFMPK
ncbi:MAG: Lrp/AsnC family transcriptional regulator [Nanoarchaeota archaeon]|nr:Lrp/AsnC family transcriptional regulator [Nanoarchaeota archaeon]